MVPAATRAQTPCVIDHQSVPASIQAIFNAPFYNGAIWGLRVDDLDSGKTLTNLQQEVAEPTGIPYSETMKLILKISYNIGADTSLLLFGLTQGVNTMDDALAVERRILPTVYGVGDDQFHSLTGPAEVKPSRPARQSSRC